MSTIIEVLERVGADSSLRHSSRQELSEVLSSEGVEPVLSSAVLSGDLMMLQTTLHVEQPVCCLIYTPEDTDSKDEDI